jgi:hypothetical protein
MPDLMPVNQNTISGLNPDTIPGDCDPTDLMVEVSLARYGVIQQDLQVRAGEIKANNALLTDYQNALAQVDAQISTDTSKDGSVTINVPQDVWATLKDSGLPVTASGTNPDGTEMVQVGSGQKLAAFLKDKVQALSNNSQMDMIQLQSQMNNLNQTMETATSILQKASDTKDKILQNIH